MFTRAHREVGELVDRDAKGRAVGAQMARSVRSNKMILGPKGPRIKIGGGGGDGRWAVGAQFGAVHYRQFPGAQADGYTVQPAIDDNLDRISEMYSDAILDQF